MCENFADIKAAVPVYMVGGWADAAIRMPIFRRLTIFPARAIDRPLAS